MRLEHEGQRDKRRAGGEDAEQSSLHGSTSNVFNGVARALFAHTYPSASARRNLREKPARSLMPQRLRYSCRWPTCPNRVRRSGFCSEHGGSRRVTTGHYGGSWPGIRAQQLQREPNCRACGRPATEVDHIRPLTPVHPGDLPGTHDPSNLASTCTDCHRRKSAAETRERRVASERRARA
jgi:5-methylcytosine-specific restriction endonuclease McrA